VNKKESIEVEKKNWYKFHIKSMNPLRNRCKKDHLSIPGGNKPIHELLKCMTCLALKKLNHRFVSEAEEMVEGNRFVRDVVCITTKDPVRFEIETDKRRAERFEQDPKRDGITVIKAWEIEAKHKSDIWAMYREVKAIVEDSVGGKRVMRREV